MSYVVVITGCSSGFGFLTAKLLQETGYTVYPTVRKQTDLKLLPNSILLDVTWPQEKIDLVIKKILKKEGKIDCLINNAGYGHLGEIISFTENEVRAQFEVNYLGVFKTIKAVLPHFRKTKSGLIINISSIAGLVTTAFYGIYSSSKFALEALTTSLRAEESLHGIKVVSVNPGSFATSFWSKKKYPEGKSLLNLKVDSIITSSKKRHQNPLLVSQTIKKIIETKNPQKNYLVGWDAYFIYYLSRILPTGLIDLLIRTTVKKLA